MYKKCPFCGRDPQIDTIKTVEEGQIKYLYSLSCPVCRKHGIFIQINGWSEEEIMKKWNERTAFIGRKANEDEIGKVTYGDLILPNGDKIICDADHKYELLEYLGIESELFNNLDYEQLCRTLGIARLSSYLAWTSIDLPNNPTKAQLDKIIEIVYTYGEVHSYGIFFKGKEEKFDNAEECIERLDKIK